MGAPGSGRVGTKCHHGLTKSYCKVCKAARAKARYGPTKINKVNVKTLVRQYKIALKHCVICMIEINETNFMMFALDHRDPTHKLFNLSQARKHSRHLVFVECKKCDLMCHNCHHLKTHKNGDHINRKVPVVAPAEYLPLLLLMQDAGKNSA